MSRSMSIMVIPYIFRTPISKAKFRSNSVADDADVQLDISSACANGSFNETHWHDPEWDRLLATAEATIDATKRVDLYYEMQQILWSRGGYLIWGFNPELDALSLRVRGAIPNPANELGNWQFRTWWFA